MEQQLVYTQLNLYSQLDDMMRRSIKVESEGQDYKVLQWNGL